MSRAISIIFFPILFIYNLFKQKINLWRDSRWLKHQKDILLMDILLKDPYHCEYINPPSINGDYYKKSKTQYFTSPHGNFSILYRICLHENSFNCVNCVRRGQMTKYDNFSFLVYCYGKSEQCYTLTAINNI